MADHTDTLLMPFESGQLRPPQSGERWACLNAQPLPQSDDDWHTHLQCQQGFRPVFMALEQGGYQVAPQTNNDSNALDGVLVLAGRVRVINEDNITRAWNALRPGGTLVFCGPKTSGAQPIRKWVGHRTVLGGSISKNHAIVFWATKDGDDWPLVDQTPSVDGYTVAPGMFSASGPDKGSQLLVESFDKRLRGCVADFGAGWGYLSAELLKRCERIEALELYEADHASLEAARKNLETAAVPIGFHWCDLTSEAPRQPFDWVIMNPPFHTGRAAEPSLGIAFIEAASRTLPQGGRLLMVANTNLPYERTIEKNFRRYEKLAQANGFKVLEAVR